MIRSHDVPYRKFLKVVYFTTYMACLGHRMCHIQDFIGFLYRVFKMKYIKWGLWINWVWIKRKVSINKMAKISKNQTGGIKMEKYEKWS